MENVTFHFHRNNRFVSKLIEWKTGSHLSHVSIELRDFYYNAYLEKRFFKTSIPATDIVESYTLQVSPEQATLIEGALNHFIDSLYDYKALFGFLFNMNEQSKGRVFCSEIANQVLEIIIPGELKHKRLVSPGNLQIALIYYLRGIDAYKPQKKTSRKK